MVASFGGFCFVFQQLVSLFPFCGAESRDMWYVARHGEMGNENRNESWKRSHGIWKYFLACQDGCGILALEGSCFALAASTHIAI
jgi:hypothetical protein